MVVTKEELHSVLLKLEATYQAKVDLWEESDALDISGIGYTNHQADDATAVYDQTVNASTIKAIRTRLRQIKEALAKIDDGTYGVCENCGREIDIARLEAIPYTLFCLRCAEAREYQAGM